MSEITQNCQTTLPPLNITLKFKSWNTKSTLGKFINHVATKEAGEGLKFPKIIIVGSKSGYVRGSTKSHQEMATGFMNGPILIVLSPRTL